ncbi:MAG TPA: MFS transporter [Oceanospirillales bacterium]|nr:MFS transporter [Oceanospirillales bacterium]
MAILKNLKKRINKKSKNINRAQVVDENFKAHVKSLIGTEISVELDEFGLSKIEFMEMFTSQIMSRQLDLMARALRLENKVFYTIGSSGHEGSVLLGRLTRHTDPAFLHYRSGGFMMERSRKITSIDPIYDTCLSFAASKDDPASGGRHKVWGSKRLWVLPQTSTIASHLPKAVGTALGIEMGKRSASGLPIPDDSIVVCNFGDASSNHSTAQGAFNAAAWAAYQGLDVPILFICEDNGLGISVKTPSGWIEKNFKHRPGLQYFQADGLDLASGYRQVQRAVNFCRYERKPVFLHLKTVRLMGHAGTDFEVDYRNIDELEAEEAKDPLLKSAEIAVKSGVLTAEEILDLYDRLNKRCMDCAYKADAQQRIETIEEVVQSLAPYSPAEVTKQAVKEIDQEQRLKFFGNVKLLPENQPKKHMAVLINKGLMDIMLKYDNALLFGEDVAQKGGVYTLTKNLYKKFSAKRVFNTLLDEQTILGLAQGYANMGMIPIPEIQYLAYFHNACDQIRGEAASLQFFSNQQFSNPMVIRIAGLGYQKGFGGHFHNDNSITALRDIPGLIVACPARGDDAVMMMRTLMALAEIDKRVSIILEPIALYMKKDLYQEGDNLWSFDYPLAAQCINIGEAKVYNEQATDILIITYGNGVPMSLEAVKTFNKTHSDTVATMDLRWLQPLNKKSICQLAEKFDTILVVDEGRESASVGEGVVSLIIENLENPPKIKKITGIDSFTPLGDASALVLPNAKIVEENLIKLAQSRRVNA